MSIATTSAAQVSIGAKGRGIGYTKGLPPGAPPEAEFTYLAPNVILAEKVRSFQVRSFSGSNWTDPNGQVEFIFQLLQIVSLGCVKLSFIMFYRRIFCTGQRTWFSISTAIMGVLVVSWTIAFFFVFLFYCGSRPWEEWSTVMNIITYCPHALDDQMALGISDSIMDVVIIALPVPAVFFKVLTLCTGSHLVDCRLDTRSPSKHCQKDDDHRRFSPWWIVSSKFSAIAHSCALTALSAVAASMVRMGIFIKVALGKIPTTSAKAAPNDKISGIQPKPGRRQ